MSRTPREQQGSWGLSETGVVSTALHGSELGGVACCSCGAPNSGRGGRDPLPHPAMISGFVPSLTVFC